jgi:hypothetical protein
MDTTAGLHHHLQMETTVLLHTIHMVHRLLLIEGIVVDTIAMRTDMIGSTKGISAVAAAVPMTIGLAPDDLAVEEFWMNQMITDMEAPVEETNRDDVPVIHGLPAECDETIPRTRIATRVEETIIAIVDPAEDDHGLLLPLVVLRTVDRTHHGDGPLEDPVEDRDPEVIREIVAVEAVTTKVGITAVAVADLVRNRATEAGDPNPRVQSEKEMEVVAGIAIVVAKVEAVIPMVRGTTRLKPSKGIRSRKLIKVPHQMIISETMILSRRCKRTWTRLHLHRVLQKRVAVVASQIASIGTDPEAAVRKERENAMGATVMTTTPIQNPLGEEKVVVNETNIAMTLQLGPPTGTSTVAIESEKAAPLPKRRSGAANIAKEITPKMMA